MSITVESHIDCHNCHAHLKHAERSTSAHDRFMDVLEKVSAVALGLFSLYTDCMLFIPSFLIGIGVGIYNHIRREGKDSSHSHSHSSCAHDVFENVTGVSLPAPLSLAAGVAVTICHIEHHAIAFVPIAGLFLGAWLGERLPSHSAMLQKKIVSMAEQATNQIAMIQKKIGQHSKVGFCAY